MEYLRPCAVFKFKISSYVILSFKLGILPFDISIEHAVIISALRLLEKKEHIRVILLKRNYWYFLIDEECHGENQFGESKSKKSVQENDDESVANKRTWRRS